MKFRQNRFTLIELIVSLAVFSILAVLVMQFFSGAQRLWLASEQRSNAYAESRATMEVINELLSSLVFCEGKDSNYDGFFRLDNSNSESASDNSTSELFFMTKTQMPLPQSASDPKNDIRFVGILRGASSGSDINHDPLYRLYLTVFCDCDVCNPDKSREKFLYAGLFTPYGVYHKSDSDKIDDRGEAKDKLSGAGGKLLPASAEHKTVLAERVLSFRITAFKADGTSAGTNADHASPPAMLRISITQMDTAENLEKWNNMTTGKDDFRKEHSRTFTRAFYLGSRQ